MVNGTWPGDQVIYNVLYNVWDNVGNPLLKVEWFPGDLRYATTFTYDGVYRLTLESRNRCCLGGDPYTTSYTYDQVGNRLSLTLNGAVTNYTYDNNDKLLTATRGSDSASCGYDLNGNMTSVSGSLFGAWSLTFDDANQPTLIQYPGGTDTFTWNALGQRWRVNINNQACYGYLYDGDRVLERTCWSGVVLRDRSATASGSYYGPLLQMKWANGNTRYPAYDGIGTVRALADQTGNITDTYTLDAFGHPIASSTGGTLNAARFGGAWGYTTDHLGSGLEQLGARFYWPELGRFIQQDPMGDGVNWYAYAGNNPLTGIDPSGLWKKGRHGELADYATSAFPYMSDNAKSQLHDHAEEPDTGWRAAWNVIGMGTWPHFGEDSSEELLSEAVRLWNDAGKTDLIGQAVARHEAMVTLGLALHNLADVLVHPKNPFSHFDVGFSEEPSNRSSEWAEAQRRSRDLVGRFLSQTR